MAIPRCVWLTCITMMLVALSPLHGEPAPADRSPASLAYSPDGRILAVLDATSREVVQINAVGNIILKRTRLDGTPSGLAWSSGSDSLFVSESGAGRISEISSTDGRLLRRFNCGRYPSGLAYAPKRKLLLCADWGLDRLTVIDTPSLIELWRNPPYLHHGRAADVREVLTRFNPDDQHGTTSQLGKADLDDLIASLLSL